MRVVLMDENWGMLSADMKEKLKVALVVEQMVVRKENWLAELWDDHKVEN
jgi:hypothetical protein